MSRRSTRKKDQNQEAQTNKKGRKKNQIYSSDEEDDVDKDISDFEEVVKPKKKLRKKRGRQSTKQSQRESNQSDQEILNEDDIDYGEGEETERRNGRKNLNEDDLDSFLDEDDYMEEEEYQIDLRGQDGDFVNFETDNNEEICFICKKEGTLLCCENCYKSYHLSCLDLKKVPSGMWECKYCIDEQKKYECNYCQQECKQDQKNLQCSLCYTYNHFECPGIPLQYIVDCPMNRQFYLNHDIQMKLDTLKTHDTEENKEKFQTAMEEIQQSKDNQPLFYMCYDCMQYCGIEKILDSSELVEGISLYLIKFECVSFLNTYWISEEQAEKIGQRKIKNFRDKKKRTEQQQQKSGENNQYENQQQIDELQEELEDYTRIERIIECKRPLKHYSTSYTDIKNKLFKQTDEENNKYESELVYGHKDNIKFYVKWRSLNYDRCTWEDEYVVYKYRDLLKKFLGVKLMEEAIGNDNLEETRKELKKVTHNPYQEKMKKQQPMYITGGCLHSFQLYGVKWISDSYLKGNNVILADEMGLGKTIQTLSYLNFMFHDQDLSGPFLVVVPATTMYNWYKESEIWADKMNVVVYMGNPESREHMRNKEFYFKIRNEKKGKKQVIPKFHILITSYDTAINDATFIRKFNWDSLVVDEAHRLKNNESKFFKVAQTFKAKHKLLLTGTPLQNNIMELINLIEFICPQKAKVLKSYESLKWFLNSSQQASKEAQENMTEEDKKVALTELTEVLKPHLLRRKKGDVDIQLPEMEEIVVKISLTDNQKYYYKNVLVKNYDNLKILDSKSKQISKFSLLNILMNLRLVCNHPFLFLYKKKYDLPIGDKFQEDFINCSNKLKFLQRVIPKLLADNHKILIFSQFVMMLDILGDYFRYLNMSYERLDGQTSVIERQRIIDSFNDKGSKSKIFLLSTRAGGLGINLTSADTIFFIDSDFNPYRDVQAISRAHRMGQVSKVKVYRLVSKYSAEERIIEIATKKLLLESIVINPLNKFTKDDFESILQEGSYEMFNKNMEQKEDDFTDAQIDMLLQRNSGETQNQNIDNVQLKKNDLNDYYLSGFKFSSLNFETVNEKKDDEQISVIQKQKYWETLLDDEAATLRNAEHEMLGKGKRVRKTLQQNTYDDERSRSYSNFSEEGNGKDKSSSEDMGDLVVEKVVLNETKKQKKQSRKEKQAFLQQQQQEVREQKQLQQQYKQKQKIQSMTNKLVNFFEHEVFTNSKVKYSNLNNKDRLRFVLNGFDEDRRVQFLSFVLEYGTEFDNLQEFFNELCRKRPDYFNSNDKVPPSFNDFRNYLKEFYAALLFYKKLDQSNAVFCKLDPAMLQRRISSLNFLSKKYQYFNKGKPERFRISHKDYFKYQIEVNQQGQIKNNDWKWTNYDDFLLCKGVFQKGYGNWEQIVDDKQLWVFNEAEDKEPFQILFQKLDEKQDRDSSQLDQDKIKQWVIVRLRNRVCNMMNWLLELDEAKQEEV